MRKAGGRERGRLLSSGSIPPLARYDRMGVYSAPAEERIHTLASSCSPSFSFSCTLALCPRLPLGSFAPTPLEHDFWRGSRPARPCLPCPCQISTRSRERSPLPSSPIRLSRRPLLPSPSSPFRRPVPSLLRPHLASTLRTQSFDVWLRVCDGAHAEMSSLPPVIAQNISRGFANLDASAS